MSQLSNDLEENFANATDSFDQGDVIKGLFVLGTMAAEIVGMITLGG